MSDSEAVTEADAPTTSQRKSPPKWLLALVAVVVLAGAGFGAYRLFFAKGADAPGECASVQGAEDDAKLTVVGCGDSGANFKIASKLDLKEKGCPDGAYREVRDASNLVCLMPNFVEGECYAADDKNGGFALTECDNPESIRISKVIVGADVATSCPNGNGVPYPQPPVVFCVETPSAS